MRYRRSERWEFVLLVLGISCDTVAPNDVKTVKSNAATHPESRRPNDDLHPLWRRDITKQQDIYNITDAHNRLRREEGASNMETMVGQLAFIIVRHAPFVPPPNPNPKFPATPLQPNPTQPSP